MATLVRSLLGACALTTLSLSAYAETTLTILRFGAHRCAERWSVADFLGMMIQIGAIPAPPAA